MSQAENYFSSESLDAYVMRGIEQVFRMKNLSMTMKKNRDQHMQMPDKEKYAREHTRLVRPPRLQPEVKEAMMQPVRKEKGSNAKPKKGKIPRM